MTTPVPAPEPVPAPHHGIAAWLEDHVVPGLRTALKDAEKARTLIPAVEAELPKLEALAEAAAPEVATGIAQTVTILRQVLTAVAAL